MPANVKNGTWKWTFTRSTKSLPFRSILPAIESEPLRKLRSAEPSRLLTPGCMTTMSEIAIARSRPQREESAVHLPEVDQRLFKISEKKEWIAWANNNGSDHFWESLRDWRFRKTNQVDT
uniref:(northern house mosquito) hypothetical protein n=1 Tax=Culex pipiens TaxID=7175 RepID=A0A8D8P4S5_CULPI